MNKDTIEGTARETLGGVKSAAGRFTGDARTQAGGLYDQAAGAAQNAAGQVKDAASEGARKVADVVKDGYGRAKEAAGGADFGRLAQDAYGQARDAADQGASAVAGQVRASPLSSVLTVGAVAFVMGWLMRGRN